MPDQYEPTEVGIYLDKWGNVWRRWADGIFRNIGPESLMAEEYAPFQRLVPESDLAAHDAQVLRDAALSGDYGTTAQSALLARADRIAGGTSHAS